MPLRKLENIPKIMRAKRWLNGARLMEQWFSRPAATKPHYGVPDTTTIKMDSWLLTFPRARKAYQTILDEKIWTSEGAKKVIADQLRKTGALTRSSDHFAQWPFGNLGLPAEKLHDQHVNHQTVSQGILDNLDDLAAALANFSLYVSVAGFVRHASTRQTAFHSPGSVWPPRFAEAPHYSREHGWPGFAVYISEVAIHVMDSYDFNDESWLPGSQRLGYWDEESNSVVKDPRLEEKYIEPGVPPAKSQYEYTEVTNKAFRDWRDKNG